MSEGRTASGTGIPSEWNVHVRVQDVLAKGPLDQTFVAGPDERAAIAERLQLLALDRLEARLHLARWGRGVEISGTMAAEVVQACVVTLEPVAERLDEPVLARFENSGTAGGTAGSALVVDDDLVDPDAPDPPDPLPPDGRIPVGELLIQLLSVALDPYPRRDGASLESALKEGKGASAGPDHPFSGLAALRKPG